MQRIALIGLGSAALLAAWAGPAHSAPTFFYVRADAGGSFPTGSDLQGFDPSPVVGAGVGFSPLPFLRTDVTISYRTDYPGSATDTTTLPGITLNEKADIKSLVGMVNAYYDFPSVAGFTPYVGGGIRLAGRCRYRHQRAAGRRDRHWLSLSRCREIPDQQHRHRAGDADLRQPGIWPAQGP